MANIKQKHVRKKRIYHPDPDSIESLDVKSTSTSKSSSTKTRETFVTTTRKTISTTSSKQQPTEITETKTISSNLNSTTTTISTATETWSPTQSLYLLLSTIWQEVEKQVQTKYPQQQMITDVPSYVTTTPTLQSQIETISVSSKVIKRILQRRAKRQF
ncbi:2752_t:CDS:2 [Ambispora gerdemannii]|uniref:2752_t:CDS:1 n=1 Tax=Ambispora gerdemannii TaxID=144530 RepID=A0A9N9B7M5_9GLOM|nr:2752_t:CDS:2 [Ambispora gerdemannii]